MKYFFLIALCIGSITADDRLVVTGYIESMCPYCRQWLRNSVKTAIYTKDFDKIVNFKLVPYGNAHQYQLSDGSYYFTCQHGDPECHGNTLQVCALAKISDFYDQYKWIICLEEKTKYSSAQFDNDAQVCSQTVPGLWEQIRDCTYGPEGNWLQHLAADETENLIPAHKFVPWINVNGKHDTAAQDAIRNDLLAWSCANYQGTNKIEACP